MIKIDSDWSQDHTIFFLFLVVGYVRYSCEFELQIVTKYHLLILIEICDKILLTNFIKILPSEKVKEFCACSVLVLVNELFSDILYLGYS